MTATDLAAYIGAAAWLPQIMTWIYKAIARPQLRVVFPPQLQIGYSSAGPIANITVAVSTSRADSLIERVRLEVRHEKGDSRTLVWQWTQANAQQATSSDGTFTSIGGQNPAVALKIPKDGLVERLIGFQDAGFLAEFDGLALPCAEELTAQRAQGETDPFQRLKTSVSYARIKDFFANQGYWKEGSYRARIVIEDRRLRGMFSASFKFQLTKPQIDSLRGNMTQLDRALRIRFGEPYDQPPVWAWIDARVTPDR
jgi:hypothetical protein